ncbi:MAG TPA: metallophosphoesterase [Pyrinomonadaceae bacterium]|nr:metallophosphoesterase [Pyrinomonadaceae bacterium]
MSTFVIGDVHARRGQLRRLLGMLPRRPGRDTLVLLGDYIDRNEDAPGTVEDVMRLAGDGSEAPVVALRGNHEQMLLDFLDHGAPLWLHPQVGSHLTFEQYTGRFLTEEMRVHAAEARELAAAAVPPEHVEFLRGLPLFYEDEHAIYVHAGLVSGLHPSETHARVLLWSRDPDFFRHYRGKPCVFGHTPTPLLPLLGRLGRHGVYVSHDAVGIDTGYLPTSPLTCLQLPEFNVYQSFADGRSATYHMTALLPESFRAFQQRDAAHD